MQCSAYSYTQYTCTIFVHITVHYRQGIIGAKEPKSVPRRLVTDLCRQAPDWLALVLNQSGALKFCLLQLPTYYVPRRQLLGTYSVTRRQSWVQILALFAPSVPHLIKGVQEMFCIKI